MTPDSSDEEDSSDTGPADNCIQGESKHLNEIIEKHGSSTKALKEIKEKHGINLEEYFARKFDQKEHFRNVMFYVSVSLLYISIFCFAGIILFDFFSQQHSISVYKLSVFGTVVIINIISLSVVIAKYSFDEEPLKEKV